MAFSNGQSCVPAGVVNAAAAVADLTCGSLCPDGVLIGTFTPGPVILWNNGIRTSTDFFSTTALRRVASYTGGSDLLGRTVRLPNKPVDFQGVVIQQFAVELGTVDNTGPLTPCVVVKTDQFQYLARVADIEEV